MHSKSRRLAGWWTATLAEHYGQIGFPTYGPTTSDCGLYETADALDAGERVHHELFHPSEPTRRLARILTRGKVMMNDMSRLVPRLSATERLILDLLREDELFGLQLVDRPTAP